MLADPEIPLANNAVWNAGCTGKGKGTSGGHRAGIVDKRKLMESEREDEQLKDN